jgi:3-dehydroquinate dehydratase I
MPRPPFTFPDSAPLVVGSLGDIAALAAATPETLAAQCDIAEVRLDLFHAEYRAKGAALWRHLLPFPLLFTARCHAEGSPFDLDLEIRAAMLRSALPDACVIDIEAASASAMEGLISEIQAAGVPWIASYHDFDQMPSGQKLATRAEIAKGAGATAFKAAARLRTIDDLSALVRFQMGGCGIRLCTMGMGALAPVSRLLCAQAGSVLNYGFIGEKPTAPGQWSAARLREGIRSLQPFR